MTTWAEGRGAPTRPAVRLTARATTTLGASPTARPTDDRLATAARCLLALLLAAVTAGAQATDPAPVTPPDAPPPPAELLAAEDVDEDDPATAVAPPTRAQLDEEDIIDLGGGWTVEVGGQLRYRFMDESNKALTDASPRKNDYHLWRTRLHTDFRNENGLRFYFEGIDARIYSEDRPYTPIDVNHVDLLNAFVEYDAGVPTARFGRTELLEGAQRLVSPLDWGNTRRTFEGGMLRFDHEADSRTDVFVTRPVIVNPHDFDNKDGSRWFSGVYHTAKLDGATWDLFSLALNQTADVVVAGDGSPGDQDLYTVGGRWSDTWGDVDYELWAAQQFGQFAGDRIDAYAWSTRVGKTFPDTPGKPRLGLDVDYASGDSNPVDDDYETFNQLFPLGHAYFGYLDLVGRQNIFDVSPNASVGLGERTTFRAAWHAFRLAQSEDALYNAGGGATFDDPTGAASRDVGDELDLTVLHKPAWWGGRSSVLVGWSRFYPGDHIDDLGGRGDAELFYLQFTLDF